MDFVSGKDFAELLTGRSNKPFNSSQLFDWLDQLLDALNYLHSHSVIHKDIKPENLKLTQNNKIKVLDFGIAKGAIGEMTIPQRSIPLGSLQYAPLEQALKACPVEYRINLLRDHQNKVEKFVNKKTCHQTDIFALCATIYRLFAKMPPEYNSINRASFVWNNEPDPLPFLHEINSKIPQKLSELIKQGMSLEIEDRVESAATMRRVLQEIKEDEQRQKEVRERGTWLSGERLKFKKEADSELARRLTEKEREWAKKFEKKEKENKEIEALQKLLIEKNELIEAYEEVIESANVELNRKKDKVKKFENEKRVYEQQFKVELQNAKNELQEGFEQELLKLNGIEKQFRESQQQIQRLTNANTYLTERVIQLHENLGKATLEKKKLIAEQRNRLDEETEIALQSGREKLEFQIGEMQIQLAEKEKLLSEAKNNLQKALNFSKQEFAELQTELEEKERNNHLLAQEIKTLNTKVADSNRKIKAKRVSLPWVIIKYFFVVSMTTFTVIGANYYYNFSYLPRYYVESGVSKAKNKDFNGAKTDFTEAIRLNVNYTDAYFQRGNVNITTNNPDQAITDYTKLIELAPKNYAAHYNRAIAYAIKGEYDKAIADYTEVVNLNPNYEQARKSAK